MKATKYFTICLIILCACLFIPLNGISAEKPVLIVTDVTGSMQTKVESPESMTQDDQESWTKAEIVKELLMHLSRELGEKPCNVGIYRMRYIAGDEAMYVVFLPIDSYDKKELARSIEKEYMTEFPVFNRRTPIAHFLRQLDENELDQMNGRVSILFISDGKETFYDLEDDWAETSASSDDRIKGPLTEVRRLKNKFGQELTFHTIYVGKQKEAEDKVTGEKLLAEMASAGGGKSFAGTMLLQEASRIKELADSLCYKTPPPVVAAPPPVVAAPPLDSDGDGVFDQDDECPGTPKGAQVDARGCWIWPGINFDTDKWVIKAEFYPVLDKIVEILKDNPELKIEIQGHTDDVGSAAYNKYLSEHRAKAVMEYFVQEGINPDRLSSTGYGSTKPKVPNDSAENRARNRRVELNPIQ